MRGEERRERSGEKRVGGFEPLQLSLQLPPLWKNFDLLAPPVFNVFHHLAHRLARETETKGEALHRRPLMPCLHARRRCARAHTRPASADDGDD